MIWNSKELAEALEIPNNVEGGNVIQFNSSDIQIGDIFIALPGGNRDAHLFAKDALNNGANFVIISKDIHSISDNKKIIVKDTLVALHKLMAYKRQKSKAMFIAITGSVGKTSTKEAIKLMLEPFGKVFVSRANFNNILGVPLNLASMPNDIDFAIFELGMNHAGEITELTKLVKPAISIITSIAEVHIANFDSIYDIIKAKSEIFSSMSKDGIAIINDDNDEYAQHMFEQAKTYNIDRIYFFGNGNRSNSQLIEYKKNGNNISLRYVILGNEISFVMPIIPKHFANNFASGLLLLVILAKDLQVAIKRLTSYKIIDGRGKLIKVTKNDKKYQVICDYYSSNPTSLSAALKNLATIDHQKKIIFMGDMLELGNKASDLHIGMIPDLINSGAYKIILVGEEAPKIKNHLVDTIISQKVNDIGLFVFDNIEQVINELPQILTNNELLLVKGSKKLTMWKILTYFDNKEDVI